MRLVLPAVATTIATAIIPAITSEPINSHSPRWPAATGTSPVDGVGSAPDSGLVSAVIDGVTAGTSVLSLASSGGSAGMNDDGENVAPSFGGRDAGPTPARRASPASLSRVIASASRGRPAGVIARQ